MGYSSHSLILKNDGTLWGCGLNNFSQLGLGDNKTRSTFTEITTNTNNVKSVYCGGRHTIILKNDGTLWGCGNNSFGQFGLGDTTNRNIFTKIITNANNIKEVYCGSYHVIILKNDGTLWGCGKNDYGQLGLGDNTNRNIFTQIATNIDDIKSICCGDNYTFILKNDNTLWGCGDNSCGQLGLGDKTNRTTFTRVTTNTDDIKEIYCGSYHAIILKNDGTLWSCGDNSFNQLGLGDNKIRTTFTQVTANTDNIKEIYCGANRTLILKNDGTLWGCGYNRYGELGLGEIADKNIFTQITTNADDIKLVCCGDNYTIILKNDDTLWGCGANNYGQLGLGDTANRNIFTKVTTNTNNIKSFPNQYEYIPFTIKVYNKNACLIETMEKINNFAKEALVQAGFTGNIDFKITLKTNDDTKTPSITKIYIEYKNN